MLLMHDLCMLASVNAGCYISIVDYVIQVDKRCMRLMHICII